MSRPDDETAPDDDTGRSTEPNVHKPGEDDGVAEKGNPTDPGNPTG